MRATPSVLVVANPVSGGGRAAHRAGEIVARLADAGLRCRAIESRPGDAREWLPVELAGVSLVVVVGGDGAVRQAASALAGGNRLLWHSPAGTENLFARSLGMREGAGPILDALGRARESRVDVGWAKAKEEHAFTLMASCGFDAEVVNDLARQRRGSISHRAYAGPILRTLRSFEPPFVTIEASIKPAEFDGVVRRDAGARKRDAPVRGTEVLGASGGAIVANGPRYALRLDPIPSARLDDGCLHAALLPSRGGVSALAWALRCVVGARPSPVSAARLLVRTDRPVHWQLDGDAAPWGPADSVEFRLQRRALPILLPATTARGRSAEPWRDSLVSPPRDWTLSPLDEEV